MLPFFSSRVPTLLLAGFLLALSVPLQGQWGMTAGYRFHFPDGWQLDPAPGSGEETQNILGHGPSLGIDYEFRLSTVRVVFLPEFALAYASARGGQLEASRTWMGSLFGHAQFYFLDMYGDCDCPTFSKQGGLVQKGLFFRVSPGLSYLDTRVEAALPDAGPGTPSGQRARLQQWAFSIGAGLGLDIGLSDRITLTPLLEARTFPGIGWDGLAELWPETGSSAVLRDERTSIWQVHLGLRAGFRLDQ